MHPFEEVSLLFKAQDYPALRAYFYHRDPDVSREAQKIVAWGKLFLPDYLRDETPPFHYSLIEENLSPRNEYTACPRGFAKTTLNQVCICYEIANRRERFIVVVEKTFNEAAEVLEMPRKEFRENSLIRAVYGDLTKLSFEGSSVSDNPDAQGDLLINGVRLRAKGFNAPIRGLKSAAYRPTKIYVDDVEEDEHIRNEEQRRKYRENYSQGIVPSVDIGGTIKVRGTILHQDSLLKNLIDQFEGTIYRAFDPTLADPTPSLLWPQRWTLPLLMEKKKQMEIDGSGSSKFSQEYLNEPVDDLRRAFPESALTRTFTASDLKFRSLNRFIAIDAAESKNLGSDDTGVVVVDVDDQNNWFVRHVKKHKVDSAELTDLIFELWRYWKPHTVGVEKKAFEFQVQPYLKIKAQQTATFPHVVELKHGGTAKADRIRGALQGLFENGKIYWQDCPQDDTASLKGQLRDFPFGKHDDLADALAYIGQIARRPAGSPSAISSATPSSWKEFFKIKKPYRRSVAGRL